MDLKPGRKVPGSCCFPDEDASKRRHGDCVYQPDADNAFMAGCIIKVAQPLQVRKKLYLNLRQFFDQNVKIIFVFPPSQIAFWALPSVMFTMLVFALCVCSRSGSSRDEYEEDTGYSRRNKRRGKLRNYYFKKSNFAETT